MMTTPASLAAPQPTTTLSTQTTRICVLGLGYVGLPTALLFAKHGFQVLGVDISPNVQQVFATNQVVDRYPELAPWWNAVRNLRINDQPQFSVAAVPAPSEVYLICVPTPVHPHNKDCDLTAVVSAAQSIVPTLRPGGLVVLESTVPPGTTRKVVKPILESTGLVVGQDIDLVFSPERILPGNTIHELVHNHRVIGGYTPQAAQRAKALFGQIVQGDLHTTDDVTAEFCKLAENTYRDVNIALANELSLIADEVGVDIGQAIPLINQHPRVNVLKPGIGVGGHCIAVDPWFFVEVSPWKTELIATSRRVNDRMPHYIVQKILAQVAHLNHPTIACLGLTYKPDVADTRESPAMRVVELLRKKGVTVRAYDPLVPEFATPHLVTQLQGSDFAAVLVPHTAMLAELEALPPAAKPIIQRFA
jgi:UDP-N-acetyl-D-mannosaminuronic acid dehydrogenase